MSRLVRSVRYAALLTLAGCAAAAPAQAALTAPAPNSVQRGDVLITEATGGTASNTCTTLGLRAQSTITITRASDNVQVFSQTKLDRGGWSTTWFTQGEQPGIYRIKSTARNRSTFCTLQAAVTLSEFNFEYRPWEHRFNDLTGGGGVFLSTSTNELQARIGSAESGVEADVAMTIVPLPEGSDPEIPEDPAGFEPPAPPASCDDDPSSCEDRLLLIDHEGSNMSVKGVFDLKTKAFVSATQVGTKSAVLKSAGTDNDAEIGAAKQQVIDAALAAGVDPSRVLDMKIRLTVPDPNSETGGTKTVSVSVREGLDIIDGSAPVGASADGLPPAVNAGTMLHLVIQSGVQGQARPYQSVTQSRRLPKTPAAFAPSVAPNPEDPANPSLTGLAAFSPGGPLTQVKGKYTAGTHSAGSYVLGWSADTSPGAKDADGNALPAWIPTLSSGTIGDTSIDFTGYAVVSNTETCIIPTLCIGVGLIYGTGASQFGPSLVATPSVAAAEDTVDANSPVPLPDTPDTPALPDAPEVPEIPAP